MAGEGGVFYWLVCGPGLEGLHCDGGRDGQGVSQTRLLGGPRKLGTPSGLPTCAYLHGTRSASAPAA